MAVDTRLALLEDDVKRLELGVYGIDGEAGINGRLRLVERFQTRIGGMAALGAVLGGVIVALAQHILA